MINAGVTSNNRFAFKLFADLLGRQPEANIFFSPISVLFALAMAGNGAAGETQRAIEQTLGLADVSINQANHHLGALRSELRGLASQVQLTLANGLWTRDTMTFAPEFLHNNREFYSADIEAVNFSDPQTIARINRWVSEQTRDKIQEIIDSLDPLTALVLINAIYFKGNWSTPFDRESTHELPFHLLDGRQKLHPLMQQSGELYYLPSADFEAIRLPYGDGRASMYIFLPSKESNLDTFCRGLNEKNWASWTHWMRRQDGTLLLPRFKLEYEVGLKPALAGLGMGVAFDPQKADFSRLGQAPQPVYISEVKHKAFVEVNEEGAEAAAATAVQFRVLGMMPFHHRFNMVVDRPFFCAIVDDQTGAILFMGAVVDPQ